MSHSPTCPTMEIYSTPVDNGDTAKYDDGEFISTLD